MPIPIILGVAAALAGAGGVGAGVHGAKKMKDANDTMKSADAQHKKNIKTFEETSTSTNKTMDKLGSLELEILKSFDAFSETIEKIQNRPDFEEYTLSGVSLPKYNKEALKKVSVGAGVLLGALGGAAVGTAGGLAAAGATTAAVMALGTASTGTAIASLSGAAAVNATLAAIGGGALAAGGGGIALGTTILGAATLGVGLLVGGVIFSVTGSKISDKADDAWAQMKKAERTINTACEYLNNLKAQAERYTKTLENVNGVYKNAFNYVSYTVNSLHKTDWNDFTEAERIATKHSVLLVGLLYNMCTVNIVIKAEKEGEMNAINQVAIDKSISDANKTLGAL